jgi:hypothetical protein
MSGRAIAMWSGPRNISTAMMRAWENRPDTRVVDEPLYAHYLATTGFDHPGRQLILSSQSKDWREVAAQLSAPVPDGAIYYQKHMTHHMTDDVELDWLENLSHVFLIRDPDEVVLSYGKIRDSATADELGFSQQLRIFHAVRERRGRIPPVIDTRATLEDPRRVLLALCDLLEIPFYEEMLSWPAGVRESDGVWAPWWYSSVEESTGFHPYRAKDEELSDQQRELSALCRPYYAELAVHAI